MLHGGSGSDSEGCMQCGVGRPVPSELCEPLNGIRSTSWTWTGAGRGLPAIPRRAAIAEMHSRQDSVL